MSALPTKADMRQRVECPLSARSGHKPKPASRIGSYFEGRAAQAHGSNGSQLASNGKNRPREVSLEANTTAEWFSERGAPAKGAKSGIDFRKGSVADVWSVSALVRFGAKWRRDLPLPDTPWLIVSLKS